MGVEGHLGLKKLNVKIDEIYTFYPANFSTLDQHCFNALDQRGNNVEPTLKMK